jgi:hypothetical protein
MWQDILKGAVANVTIDWMELDSLYYNTMNVYEAEGSKIIRESINTRENPIVEKAEVKYSIGIYRDNDGIAIKFHSGTARITIEGQVLEKDFEEFNYGQNTIDYERNGMIHIKPSFLGGSIIKHLNKDGKFKFARHGMWLEME